MTANEFDPSLSTFNKNENLIAFFEKPQIDYDVMVFVRYSFIQRTDVTSNEVHILWQNAFSSIVIMPYSMYSKIRKIIILNKLHCFSEIQLIKPRAKRLSVVDLVTYPQ